MEIVFILPQRHVSQLIQKEETEKGRRMNCAQGVHNSSAIHAGLRAVRVHGSDNSVRFNKYGITGKMEERRADRGCG